MLKPRHFPDERVDSSPDLLTISQQLNLGTEVNIAHIIQLVDTAVKCCSCSVLESDAGVLGPLRQGKPYNRSRVGAGVQGDLGVSGAAAWVAIHVFGSCGLGAATLKSDIDLLVLCSLHYPLERLFQEVPPQLQRVVSAAGTVSTVSVVSSARVPLVKWRFEDRVDVDIVFARVGLPAPPSVEQLMERDFPFKVSLDTRPSINGLRSCLAIRRQLPVPMEVYSAVLRMVKCWASRRAVYNKLLTYPNGVILAIMVARICIDWKTLTTSPKPTAEGIFVAFFITYAKMFSQFPVPPIYITEKPEPPDPNSRIPGLPICWDYRSPAAKDELLQVLNPAYPYVNSSHGIGRAGFNCFAEELHRAASLLSCQQNVSAAALPIYTILEPYSFPAAYQHFVGVHVRCELLSGDKNALEDAFLHWKGFIVSQIRIFIYALECLMDVRPYPLSTAPLHASSSVETLQSSKECILWVAVADEESRFHEERLTNAVRASFQYLQLSVQDGCRPPPSSSRVLSSPAYPSSTPYHFARDPAVMKDPWWTIHTREEVVVVLPIASGTR